MKQIPSAAHYMASQMDLGICSIFKVMQLKRCLCLVFLLAFVSHGLSGQVSFADRSLRSGIFDLGSNHGVSIGDINNDGLEDVYVAVRTTGAPNRLYLNKGGIEFEEIASQAGVADLGQSTAATWGDINNDGFIDLYVGNTGTANVLYLNNGDLTFTDITMEAGVGDEFDPRSVHFADVDNDGWLDIYVHNFNTENVLYKNNGDNTFADFTQQSGALDIGPAMGTIFFDMDDDGDQDLYVLNDGSKNAFFENNGDGTFRNISAGSGLDISCSCMGADFGDYDQDGDYDIYITNWGINFLFENNGDGTFTDQGEFYDVDDTGVGWGTFWFDYDNDGDQDIYLANNQTLSAVPNILYRNNGGKEFELVSTDSDIESPFASFGTAAVDVDNDGFQDIVVANWGGNARNRLYVNEENGNNAILIKAIGTSSNASAIGANVIIRAGGKIQMDQVNGATGYASQSSLVLHFGLGDIEVIDELIIKWPSGIEESYVDLPVNQYFIITEDQGMRSVGLGEDIVTSVAGVEARQSLESYPNPFVQRTFIPVQEQIGSFQFEVFALNGDLVNRSADMTEQNGVAGFEWKGEALSGYAVNDGVYIYRIKNKDGLVLKTGKLVLARR